MSHVDGLIEISRNAHKETFQWERTNRRMQVVNRAILVVVSLLFCWDVYLIITGVSVVSTLTTVMALGLVGLYIWLIQHNKNHQAWILECRAKWDSSLHHWQAVKMEYEETGAYPLWAFRPPDHEDYE